MDFVDAFLLGIVAFVVLAFAAVIYVVVVDSRSPTFELQKNDWTCTESHQQSVTTMMLVGKVMIPQTNIVTVCDNYHRR